jgi:hypothetical protein
MEQEENSSSMHILDTDEFIEHLKEHGFTMVELLRAEDEVHVSSISKIYTTPDGTWQIELSKTWQQTRKVDRGEVHFHHHAGLLIELSVMR